MSDESITVSSNNALLADVYKWKQRYRELKAQHDAVVKERDELAARFEQLQNDAAEIAEAYESLDAEIKANPSELQQQLQTLQRELWTRDRKAEFAKLATEHNVRPEAHDDLWSLLGVDPDKDAEINADGLRERIGEAVKARAYLLKSDAETAHGAAGAAQGQPTGKPAIPARPAGPGLSRGAPESPASSDPRAAASAKLSAAGAIAPNGNLRLA